MAKTQNKNWQLEHIDYKNLVLIQTNDIKAQKNLGMVTFVRYSHGYKYFD
jgi:hypothetical protein